MLVNVETSVNIRYGYDIRGEVVGETGTAALADRGPGRRAQRNRVGVAVPEDWRERFIARLRRRVPGVDQRGHGRRGATGPSAWDGYAAAGRLRRRRGGPLQRRPGRDRARRQARPLQLTASHTRALVEHERSCHEGRARPLHVPHDAAAASCRAWSPISAIEYIELSPREDLTPFFLHPRTDDGDVRRFKTALDAAGRQGRHAPAALPLVRTRTRTSARPRCATGSGPSRSPSISTAR